MSYLMTDYKKVMAKQHIPTMTDSHHGGNMLAMKVV